MGGRMFGHEEIPILELTAGDLSPIMAATKGATMEGLEGLCDFEQGVEEAGAEYGGAHA